MPNRIQNASKHEESQYEAKAEPDWIYERKWACCCCGEHAGMDVDASPCCVGCSHSRCTTCQTEPSKRTTAREGFIRSQLPKTHQPHIVECPTLRDKDNRTRDEKDLAWGLASQNITENRAPDIQSIFIHDSTSRQISTYGVSNSSLKEDRTSGESSNPQAHQYSTHQASNESGQSSHKQFLPHFACPFFKKDPNTYGPWNNRYYIQCVAPCVPQHRIDRLKEHLKLHKLLCCEKCSSVFNNKKKLKDHQEQQQACLRRPPIPQEGISEKQNRTIDTILKMKGISLENKWFQIWDEIFHDVERPSNPYTEPLVPLRPSIFDTKSLMSSFEHEIQLEINQGTLELSALARRSIINAFRRTILVKMPTLTNTISCDSPLKDVNECKSELFGLPSDLADTDLTRLGHLGTENANNLLQDFASTLPQYDIDFGLADLSFMSSSLPLSSHAADLHNVGLSVPTMPTEPMQTNGVDLFYNPFDSTRAGYLHKPPNVTIEPGQETIISVPNETSMPTCEVIQEPLDAFFNFDLNLSTSSSLSNSLFVSNGASMALEPNLGQTSFDTFFGYDLGETDANFWDSTLVEGEARAETNFWIDESDLNFRSNVSNDYLTSLLGLDDEPSTAPVQVERDHN